MPRLGEFQFEPESGQLSRNGEVRRLEPQPAKVLALLASRPGQVVSHEELRAHVWGEETYVDFERGLRYCIAQIRAALGDSAQSPRFIETLPKRGYRLRVPASPEDDRPGEGGNAVPEAPLASFEPRLRAHRPREGPAVALGIALVVLLVVTTVGWLFRKPIPPRAPVPAFTVAVVPFDNETGEAGNDSLARSFSDAVVARLAAADPKRLAVVGNAAALFVRREDRDLQALGRELGAGYLVLGQFQRQEGHARVIAHLVRVGDQKHLWANRFEQGELPALAFEAQVADEVAAAVRRQLLEPPSPP